MTAPPVTTRELVDLLHRIRSLPDNPTIDPADRAETIARKADQPDWRRTWVKTIPYHRPMDALALGLQRLGAAETKPQLVDALWDLRDSAYDQPQAWTAITAETLLQALAEELDQAPPDDNGQIPIHVLARAFEKALDPRLSGG